ncbi:hypothetical protein C8R43DRAFT_1000503 [Mycena crocata]|nr:hypothetical protein C8R43DRAFT_1000503 [Mycena crocata]
MLWQHQERKTRSGAVFSPFWPPSAVTLQSLSFDLAPLLRAAIAREGGEADELEEDELNTVDDLPLLDQSGVDDGPLAAGGPSRDPPSRSPSPPPKRPRLDKVPTRNHHRHLKRRRTRDIEKEGGPVRRQATLLAQVAANKDHALIAPLDALDLPVARGGYSAKVGDTYGSKKRRTLAEVLALGFRLVKWDGIEPRPIVDAMGRIAAVLAGQPRDPTYAADATAAYKRHPHRAQRHTFLGQNDHHRRGPFPALNVGLSYGKGQRVPSYLRNGHNAALLQRLIGNPAFDGMACFASAAFSLWAPKVFHPTSHLPHLPRNFDRSVFACAAFNFGPNVWTFKHRDVLNIPFGWCAVQALGRFDPRKGGHLILWDLKLVIEFPHGATILLPSATVEHSNIPVQPGDERASFTQYTAGGLMRYVDNGFRTEQELEEQDPAAYKEMWADKEARWEMGISLLSTVDELLEDL